MQGGAGRGDARRLRHKSLKASQGYRCATYCRPYAIAAHLFAAPGGTWKSGEQIGCHKTVIRVFKYHNAAMSNGSKILTSAARLDDAKAMASLLASIPDSAELAGLLVSEADLNTRAYDDANLTARFVISDGVTATCFAVYDITIDQAEMITVECEKSNAWNEAAFRLAAARALG